MSSLLKDKEQKREEKSVIKHAIVGAGPSGIQLVMDFLDQCLLGQVKPDELLWIDKYFNAGALSGELLSIDGNTAIKKYLMVFEEWFNRLKAFGITVPKDEFAIFMTTYEDMFALAKKQGVIFNESAQEITTKYPDLQDYCCPLSMVTPVLQRVTKELQSLIPHRRGALQKVDSSVAGVNLTVDLGDNSIAVIPARTVILALGAAPRTLKDLPNYDPKSAKMQREISPWLAFSLPDLEKFLQENAQKVKKVIILGGSHSGALVHKNILLLSEKREVKVVAHTLARSMPKFRHNDPLTGITRNNNSGLDGNSARFMLSMLFNQEAAARYAGQWQYQILGKEITFDDVPDEEGTYVVCTIGFKAPDDVIISNERQEPLPLVKFIEKHSPPIPMGGSYRDGIFLAGIVSPVLDEDGVSNIGITKMPADSQRLVRLAMARAKEDIGAKLDAGSPSKAAFFAALGSVVIEKAPEKVPLLVPKEALPMIPRSRL